MLLNKSYHIPKLLPPKTNNVYRRARLHDMLDDKEDQRIIWVTSPAGSGKTTFIANYLEEQQLASIWYQVDEGDGDVAAFFYYLGMAERNASAEKYKALPNLTAEYQLGISVFARNYFRDFFSRIESGTVFVFDNYQDVPEDCALHKVINIFLDEMPGGMQTIVISRSNPPGEFSRNSLSPYFTMLDWNQIKLTEKECIGLIAHHEGIVIEEEDIQEITRLSQGWMAGLVLLLKQNYKKSSKSIIENIHTQSDLFGYFANEIFNHLDFQAQEALMQTSLLPSFTMSMTKELTGQTKAKELITDLVKNQFFVSQHRQLTDSYEYHPLFQTFLLKRFKDTYKPEVQIEIQQNAAKILAENGQIEDSAALLIKTNEWESLSNLVLTNAQTIITQGRSQTLQQWLSVIPGDVLENKPWLLYWYGYCYLAFNPGLARSYFDRAFNQFKNQNNQEGLFLSWSGVINTFLYEWGDFSAADKWIDVFDELYIDNPDFPTTEIEAHVSSSILSILMWRRPSRSDLPYWAERVKLIILRLSDSQLRILLGNNLVIYHLWMGNLSTATMIIDSLRETGTSRLSDPLTRLNWYVMEAMHAWFVADHDACLNAMNEGSRLAESCGIHLLDLYLYAQGVYSGMTQGDLVLASKLIKKMSKLNIGRIMDKSLYHYQSGSIAWREGDLHRSIENYYASVELAEKTGAALPEALCRFELAITLFRQGKYESATEQLAKTKKVSQGMNHIEFMCLLHGSHFALEQGDETQGIKLLREAMALGAQQRYVNYPRWDNEFMSKFCCLAIDHGVETDYVKSLIRIRNLVPTDPASYLDSWPWAVKIKTLGRFEIIVDGNSVDADKKGMGKPIELLKILIAYGATDVKEEKISDALWPDTDGDQAKQNFKTTLHRLRKIFNNNDVLILKNRKLSLDNSHCWVDTWLLLRLLSQVNGTISDAIEQRSCEQLSSKIINLYDAEFMDGETSNWVLSMRENLRNKFIKQMLRLANQLEKSNQLDNAVDGYQKIIDVEPLTEDAYRGLMCCHIKQDQKPAAVAVYQKCKNLFNERLGIEPSDAIEKIYASIIE